MWVIGNCTSKTMNCLVLDNGAGKIKYGINTCQSDGNEVPTGTMTNAIARIHKQMQILIGNDIDKFANGSLLQYNRPFDRGYLNNWQTEAEIWGRLFCPNMLNIVPGNHQLVMTEPPFNPEPWQDDTNEVVFEHFGFESYVRKPAAWFSAYKFMQDNPFGQEFSNCCEIIDSGFSFTHSFPFVDMQCQREGCRRVNVGGKLLTNYLKEVVSFRQWNMMDEFKLIDQVKESLCYLTTSFDKDLVNSSKKIQRERDGNSSYAVCDPNGLQLKRHFVLPDFVDVQKGFVKPLDEQQSPQEQLLAMDIERFTVPEVLFHPSDIGLDMAGLAEATAQSLQSLNTVQMGLCAANIVLTGGNAKFSNMSEKVEQELRPMLPDMHPIQVYLPDNPDHYAWCGANKFVNDCRRSNQLQSHMISKAEYLENGHHYCNERFKNMW